MLHFQTLKPVIVRRADVPAVERDVPTINDPLGFQNLHRHFAAIAIGERVMSGLSNWRSPIGDGLCLTRRYQAPYNPPGDKPLVVALHRG